MAFNDQPGVLLIGPFLHSQKTEVPARRRAGRIKTTPVILNRQDPKSDA